MRILLLSALLVIALVQCKPLNNPLAKLMDQDASKETKKFGNMVLETVISHVAMARFGMPPSLEEMKNDFANITATFMLLPLPDQKKLYKTFKGLGENTRANLSSGHSELAAFEALEKRFNSAAAKEIFAEIDKKFNILEQPSETLAFIRAKDPELATVCEKFLKEGQEQYKLIKTQEGKDFVWNSLVYLESRKDKTESVSDDSLTHLKTEFAKLSQENRVDVIKRMTWYLNPVYEFLHKMITAAAATGKMIT